jgi:hypothetical protein
MDILGPIMGKLPAILVGLTAVERVPTGKNIQKPATVWMWVILLGAIGVVLAMVLAYVVSRIRARRREGWTAFHALADNLGLGGEERDLLAHVAELAGVRNVQSIFTLDDAFREGANAFLQGPRFLSMDETARAYALSLVGSLREKLGFHTANDAEMQSLTSTRQIAEGTKVTILHRGSPGTFEATVWQSGSKEFIVEPEAPVEPRLGEGWLVRIADGGSVWEFDAPVLNAMDGRIVLGHSDYVRFINRRRFPRIPVNRSALLAPFPFVKPDASDAPPVFYPATLVEIGGPGLKFESSCELQPGEKALVVLKLQDRKVVEALGKVRRLLPNRKGRPFVIIELIGLNSAEVSELARETNAAAKEQSAAGNQESEETEVAAGSPV